MIAAGTGVMVLCADPLDMAAAAFAAQDRLVLGPGHLLVAPAGPTVHVAGSARDLVYPGDEGFDHLG